MVPLAAALWLAVMAALVVGFLSAIAMHWWCTHRRRPSLRYSVQAAGLDPRTEAVLRAVDDLPLGEAFAVLSEIRTLIDAGATVARLWPDAGNLSAGAVVQRIAGQATPRPPRPRLVPPA